MTEDEIKRVGEIKEYYRASFPDFEVRMALASNRNQFNYDNVDFLLTLAERLSKTIENKLKFIGCAKCGFEYILADTEDWAYPICNDCFEGLERLTNVKLYDQNKELQEENAKLIAAHDKDHGDSAKEIVQNWVEINKLRGALKFVREDDWSWNKLLEVTGEALEPPTHEKVNSDA